MTESKLPKSTTPHLTTLTLLETSASYSMNSSPFLVRSHLSPNLAITIFVSFAVSVHTWIPKQLRPSPLPVFIPSLTTATLFITTCPSLRSLGSNRSRTQALNTSSFHLYKVHTTTQPTYLHNLITVEPPRSTRSSSLVTLTRPSTATSSSLRITHRPFHASPRL